MIKSLTTNGNTWQLYINKPIAQLIGITSEEYAVSFVISNKVLYIEKVNDKSLQEDILVKKLIKRNAGYGLNFPIPILELLEINPEQDCLEVNVDGRRLIIQKAVE